MKSNTEHNHIIEKLKKAIVENRISFKVLPPDLSLSDIFYRRIRIKIRDVQFDFAVNDEYEDVDAANPLVLLHLVLRECDDFEEAEDYLVWTNDLGLDAANNTVRQLYFELREKVPEIRQLVGNGVKPVSHRDMEMNTGIMRALRSANLDD